MPKNSLTRRRILNVRAARASLLGSLLWIGCGSGVNDHSPAPGSARNPEAVGLAPSAPTKGDGALPHARAVADGIEAGGFWKEFRRAALDGDSVTLLAMTEFPFHVRGPTDADPLVELDSAAFLAILPRLLDADPGLAAQPSTMRKLLEESAMPPPGVANGDEARVGDFVFTRRAGRWRFSLAYLTSTFDM